MKSFMKNFGVEILAAAAVFAVFAMALSFGFLTHWDDSSYIISNQALSPTLKNFIQYFRHCPQGFYAPLTMHSFMLDYLFWGKDPFGYHLTNILLQCCSCLLLIRIMRRLGISPALALIFSLLWAVAPQRVESVVWIAERKDVLSGVLALFSLLLFMRECDSGKKPFVSFIVYAAAILAKPSVVGLPVIFAVYAVYRSKRRDLAWKWVLSSAAASAGIVLILLWIMPVFRYLETPGRVFSVVVHNFIFYVSNTILPGELNPIYPQVEFADWWIIPVFAAVCVCWNYVGRCCGISFAEQKKTVLAFLIVYCAFFIAVTGGFQFNATDYADRYSYLPSLAVWGWLAFSASRWSAALSPKKQQWIVLFFGFLLLCSAIRTLNYIPKWRNNQTLSDYALFASSKTNDKACIFRAVSAWEVRQADGLRLAAKMIAENAGYRFPRDIAVTSEARMNAAYIFLCLAEICDRNTQAALKYFREIRHRLKSGKLNFISSEVYLHPWRREMYVLLGTAGNKGELADFLEWCDRDKNGWNMSDPFELFYKGMLYWNRKNYQDAAATWRLALMLNPGDANISRNLQAAEKILSENKQSVLPENGKR